MTYTKKVKYNGYLYLVMPLTETQKRHLLSREDQPVAIRKNNEFAIRKHIEKFLQYCEDMKIVLDHLPENQIKRYLKDDHVYMFLRFAIRLMEIMEFRPIEGDVEDPDHWHVTTSWTDSKNKELKFDSRPASIIDVDRNIELNSLLERLDRFVSSNDPAFIEYKRKKPRRISRRIRHANGAGSELVERVKRLAERPDDEAIESRSEEEDQL